MNDIYNDLQASPETTVQETGGQLFDKTAWAEKKKDEKDGAYQMIESTVDSISQDGDKLQKYLNMQSHLDKYSMCNTVLIMTQKPDATQLKDYDGWKESGTGVRPKEKGIVILEPAGEYYREDGSTATSFKTKKVFDLAQTFTKDKTKPQINRDEKFVLKALIQNAVVPIKAVDSLEIPTMGAFYDHNQKAVLVRKGLDNKDFFMTVSQELAHATLAQKGDYSRNACGFKAVCTSYMLCKRYGIDTAAFNFKELPANFRNQNQKELRNTLEDMRNAMTDINDRMSKTFEQNRSAKQKDMER